MILDTFDIVCLVLIIVGSLLAIVELAVFGTDILFKQGD